MSNATAAPVMTRMPAKTGSTSGFRTQRFVPAIASAVLLWLSFPPADCGYFAWFALAPLFLLIRSDRPRREIYLAAWLGGEVFWLLSIEWVRRTDPSAWLGWVVMATVLSVWWPVFLALARHADRRLGLPLLLSAPIIWVAGEYIQSYMLTGFPWYYLAHSQYRYLPLIQISDIAGTWGLSFLVAMVNAWWVELLTLPLLRPTRNGPRVTRPQTVRLAVVLLALACTLGYGWYRIGTAQFRTGPKLALLQSSLEQSLKLSPELDQIILRYRKLITDALPEKPDLIVWPETSYPRGYPRINPTLDAKKFERQIKALHPKGTIAYWRDKAEIVRLELNGWTDSMKIPMLVGTTTYEFRHDGAFRYNGALLFQPAEPEIQSYYKLHLVPFGEYVPLIQSLPWLTRLTPYHGEFTPSLTPGMKPAWFDFKGIRIATAICFEDTIPRVVRRFFAEAPDGRHPDLLINISNDGWFGGSSELDMHLAISVFRCVEHRVPMARAVNTGISALIDGNGLIVQSLPKLKETVLAGTVRFDDRKSLYSACGDWFPKLCLAMTIGFVPVGWFLRRRAPERASRMA
jgi:apolipoprotein N-acyltransferase